MYFVKGVPRMTIGEKIAHLRISKNISQEQHFQDVIKQIIDTVL